MTGISTSGIRFYEEAGVISPLRGENGRYREYSLNDLQLLLMCRIYRDYGFSLQESVELINHSDISKIRGCTQDQYSRLSREIKRKQVLLEFLGRRIEDLKEHQSKTAPCQIIQSPPLLRVQLWQPGMKEGDYVPHAQIYEWMDLSPVTESCLILPEESFVNGHGELKTLWGLSIEESYAVSLNFTPTAKVERIPSNKCVRMVISILENLSISSKQLTAAREFIDQNRLKPAGPAVSRLFFAENHQQHFDRRDFLWIPVCEK